MAGERQKGYIVRLETRLLLPNKKYQPIVAGTLNTGPQRERADLLVRTLRWWWMPTNADPSPSCCHNNLVIHPQRDDGSASSRGQTDETNARIVPCKVSIPLLLTGVKQGDNRACEGVFQFSLSPFELVAAMAGDTQVFSRRWAIFATWGNVLHDHRVTGISLGGRAIGTLVTIRLDQSLTQLRG